ncbi:uncharacterized protein HaLaN_25264 [Haematococcus lacustris]|uniref:Uncharacterized protein n=1 Tax=Haematococcus lacustris TaxID=44745 RepID=A0A699ZWF1_HAELA|nr:uncharacterized protein HaLaN_25264 [Haematococcus lacustris]
MDLPEGKSTDAPSRLPSSILRRDVRPSLSRRLQLLACVYIIVEYQHPEDKNQAWFPKIVDVANKAACSANLSPTACSYTLPMYTIWMAVFIANLVLVYAFIPFTLFLYEADSEL